MNNKAMPTKDTMFLTFSGIFFLLIPSIAVTNNCHPSNPGNGSKLTIARLTDINPHTYKNVPSPKFLRIDVVSNPIPTNPEASFHALGFVTKDPIPLTIAVLEVPKSTKVPFKDSPKDCHLSSWNK